MTTVEQGVLAYCEAIRTQEEAHFRAVWSDRSECALISVGKVYRGLPSICADFLLGAIRRAYSSIVLVPEQIIETYRDADTAIVVFRYHTECVRREDGSPYGISGVETQVWKREDGWRLLHVHYSKV